MLTWSDVASSTCVKTTVKLCVLGRMPCKLCDILKESFGFMPVIRHCSMKCELCCKLCDILKESFRFMPVVRHCSMKCELCCKLCDILKESFRFMPVVRHCSMKCELCCKYWVDRCYRHPLQSCVPCGACMWGSDICTRVDMHAHIRATECCVQHTLMLTSGNYDRV